MERLKIGMTVKAKRSISPHWFGRNDNSMPKSNLGKVLYIHPLNRFVSVGFYKNKKLLYRQSFGPEDLTPVKEQECKA